MPSIAVDLAANERAAVALSRGDPIVLDGWLGPVRAMALRLEVRALLDAQRFRAAGVGGGQGHVLAPDVRGDSVCWFRDGAQVDDDGDDDDDGAGARPGAEVALFLARLDLLVQHLNCTCFLGLQKVECHAACFEPGAFYRAHVDALRGDGRRVLSYCYYLNEAWTEADGGCLRLHRNPLVDVAPLLDRIVVFPSALLLHQVLPTAVRRLSLTGWLSRARPVNG